MSLNACAAIVEKADPDRFLAAMSCAPAAREVLFPLFAFNIEIARAPWLTKEPMIAEMRLQWWRDAIEEIVGGGAVRKHEVVTPLTDLMRKHELPGALFDATIEARRWDILEEPFEDEADFSAHLEATSGNLAWAAALAFGAPDDLETPLRQAAWAGGLANWFVAVPALEAAGMMPLVDGRPNAIADLAQRGLANIKAARRSDFGAATPAVRPFWRAKALLKQITKYPSRVANDTLGTSEFQRRTSLLFKSTVGGW